MTTTVGKAMPSATLVPGRRMAFAAFACSAGLPIRPRVSGPVWATPSVDVAVLHDALTFAQGASVSRFVLARREALVCGPTVPKRYSHVMAFVRQFSCWHCLRFDACTFRVWRALCGSLVGRVEIPC